MAENYPDTSDPLLLKINSHFDQIVDKINERRNTILTEVRERREISRDKDTEQEEKISQILALKSVVSGPKENTLQHVQQKWINELEAELETLKITPEKTVLQFSINSNFIEESLDTLGEITEGNAPIDYGTLESAIAVAKQGKDPGELNGPQGVAIDETTGNIFVVEYSNSRVSIFSQTGEYIQSFGDKLFHAPCGIAIHNSNLYVTDVFLKTIFQFQLPDLKLIRRVGKEGTGKNEFYYPSQLFISEIGDVYVCDKSNNRIQVLTSELKFKYFFTPQFLTEPTDVKLTDKLMYVLTDADNPCLHIFTRSGEKIRSIGMQITKPLFFCIDFTGNIIISDAEGHSIKVFTPEGEFLHQIGQRGHDKGMFFQPRGIALSKDGKLICVSDNENFGVQIFV